ncbi:MAG: HsdM family class I SAM-dependent methyltransferase, partial [Promethearchaeota archaeon]
MKKLSHFHDFKESFSLFDIAIKLNDIKGMKNLINLIKKNENLFLEGYQKKKEEGAYYTNKKISKFIIQECLLSIINEKLKNDDGFPNNIEKIKDIYKLNRGLQDKIHELLINTSICDPACGSGVFLLNAAEVIYNILKKINRENDSKKLKFEIIKNIFGLDINEYAIKLSILKLFAWILKDSNSDHSQGLKILTLNIRVENSLFAKNWTKNLFNKSKFDVIVGNPPYGNILTKKEKQILKNENFFYTDSYCAFVLKAIEWSNGIIGFLVPKSFLLRQGYVEFRNQLFSKVILLKIYDIGSKMFKGATNEVQIVLFNKDQGNPNQDLLIYDYPNNKIITYKNQNVDALRICLNNSCPLSVNVKKIYTYTFEKKCPYCNSETIKLNRIRIKPTSNILDILNKIERNGDLNYLNPIDFPKMVRGEESKGLI